MKKFLIITALVIFVQQLQAQTADDALRIAQNYYEGTARSMAMGGSFGALGADFSTASTNPAGLALFRKSEYSFSPIINFNYIESRYNGETQNDENVDLNISNMGYVKVIKNSSSNANTWKYFQFSFGMNRLRNFNSNKTMAGNNAYNSKLDVYLENADGIPYGDIENDPNGYYGFDLQQAWQLYLIDTIPGYQDWYYSAVPFAGVYQKEQVRTRGALNEWFFSLSANINETLYLGATLGFPSLNYTRDSYYSETDAADTIPYFQSWEYDQSLQTTGTGVNVKVGAIVQPAKWLRVGLAYHSPTYYFSLQDNWYTSTYANLEWTNPQTVSSPTGTYDYHLKTPSKFLGSLGLILFNRGSFSAEYEWVNYSKMSLNASSYNFQAENKDIETYYQSTHNFRMGTEWRFGFVDLRAGYAVYGSPYARNFNDGKRESVSGGLGFHFKNYVLDLAYVHATRNSDYYFYGSNDISVNPVHNSYTNNSLVMSLSFRF